MVINPLVLAETTDMNIGAVPSRVVVLCNVTALPRVSDIVPGCSINGVSPFQTEFAL